MRTRNENLSGRASWGKRARSCWDFNKATIMPPPPPPYYLQHLPRLQSILLVFMSCLHLVRAAARSNQQFLGAMATAQDDDENTYYVAVVLWLQGGLTSRCTEYSVQ